MAAFAAAAFLPAVPVATPFPAAAFAALATSAWPVFFFVMIVVPALESDVLLPSLPLPLPSTFVMAAAPAAAVTVPLPRPVAADGTIVGPPRACLLAVRPVRTAGFSTTGTGADGLSGEVGRAGYDFGGDIAPEDLKGDLGRVRELFDLGERTCEGTILRDAVLVARLFAVTGPWAAVMVALARFLGIIRSWSVCVFSLSEAISLLLKYVLASLNV